MPDMSTHTQNRSRTPAGVPTGGQFATERRGEAGLSTLAGQPAAVEDDPIERGRAARAAFDANPLDLNPQHARTLLEEARSDLAATRRRIRELDATYDQLSLADDRRRQVLDELRDTEDAAQTKKWTAASAAVRHAASGDEGMAELLEEMDASDRERLDEVGLSIHPTILQQQALHMRQSVAAARADGIGEGSQPISQAQARRSLPVGTRVRRTYLQAARDAPTKVVITSQSSYQQVSTNADGGETVLGWVGTRAHQDAAGNIIVTSEHGLPFVAFRPEGD
jgi:hypothetical protein